MLGGGEGADLEHNSPRAGRNTVVLRPFSNMFDDVSIISMGCMQNGPGEELGHPRAVEILYGSHKPLFSRVKKHNSVKIAH